MSVTSKRLLEADWMKCRFTQVHHSLKCSFKLSWCVNNTQWSILPNVLFHMNVSWVPFSPSFLPWLAVPLFSLFYPVPWLVVLWRIIESVCIGWFTAECLVRFLVSRDKCEYVLRPLNIIDLLAIMPYYISVTMTMLTGENSQLQRAGVALRALRMMRIFWVIKLARHFLGLQTLGLTLRRCYREMVMLLVFICVAMAIFSALAQLLEHGLDLETGNQDYASIPAACWWVVISMTTVGYGDMYPVTVAGRVLGGVCVVSGIVLLALPITFIYHSFVQCYHELKVLSARNCRPILTSETEDGEASTDHHAGRTGEPPEASLPYTK